MPARPDLALDAPDRVGVVPFAAELARHGQRPALVTPDVTVTYAALAAMVDDVRRTERRLVVSHLTPEVASVVRYLAALAAGDPVLVVPPGSTGEAIAQPYREATDLHPDLALMLSTSGSTGSPKLVRLSHDNVQHNADAIAASLGLTCDDVGITSLPLHYTYGLSVLHSHLAVGASVVLTDLSVVDTCFWDLVDRHRVSTLAAVPFTFELLDRSGFADRRHPSLRRVTQAGGRLPPDAVRRWAMHGRGHGWDLVVMYGQTEATARMTVLPPELALTHPTSVGRPIAGGRVRLAPIDHADPAAGELVYSGPNVMLGYAESATDLARGRDVHELRTGDLARIDGDGLVHVVGRLARMVKPFGVRIDLAALETEMERRGHRVVIVGDDEGLVVCGSADADAVDDAVAACRHITGLPAASVRPLVIDDLPRLANGKTDTEALLRLGRTGDTAPADTTSPVRSVLCDVLGRRGVTDDDTFVSLGGDSLSYVEVSIRLEEAIGCVPEGWHVMSVADLEAIARANATTSLTTARSGRFVDMDTTVVLRAAAIALVVAHHTELIGFAGGAHTMLVLAGYNFARFHLHRSDGTIRQLWRTIAVIAIPSIAWMMVQSLYWDHGWKNFVLMHNYLGAMPLGPAWRYWYIEVVIQTMVVLALALSVRRVREFESRHRYGVAAGVLGVTLAARWLIAPPAGHYAIFTTHTVIWLFALGWFVQRSNDRQRRVIASLVAMAALPGFFVGEVSREVVVLVGVLVLAWVPKVRMPRAMVRPVGLVAGASLAIYLTHWQVYHPLRPEVPAWIVAPLCIAIGVATWLGAQRVVRFVRERWTRDLDPVAAPA